MIRRIEALTHDREHGASFLARRAVEILVEGAAAGTDPLTLARALAATRPAMGAIAGSVGRIVATAHGPEQVVQEGRALLARYERAARSIAVLAGPQVQGLVATYSTSATVAEVIRHAGLERAAALGEADVLLLGADSVFRDGSIVNAAGTHAVAQEAADLGLPVVVAAETLKLVPTGGVAPEEDLFELTPAHLIDRIATEEGVFAPDEIGALVDQTPLLREGYELVAPAPVR